MVCYLGSAYYGWLSHIHVRFVLVPNSFDTLFVSSSLYSNTFELVVLLNVLLPVTTQVSHNQHRLLLLDFYYKSLKIHKINLNGSINIEITIMMLVSHIDMMHMHITH